MASEQEKNLIEILEENNPIDVNKYTNYVHSPQCGAIATFYGNTRDTFDGKTVIELRYEAYVPMAIRCLTTICSSARSMWDVNAIAVAHRLGPVSVGETSVFVAVSSVHRVDALDACKFVIDEIKASVPIWKKEVYSNGEVWKENMEFLERKQEVGKDLKRVCCRPKVKVEEEVAAPVKNGCCRQKVKVVEEEVVAAPVENGCCRPKVKVVAEEKGVDLEELSLNMSLDQGTSVISEVEETHGC